MVMNNNKMRVVKSYTTVNNFGSDTIKRDFEREGKINIIFYIQNKFIGVDVNGFSNTWSYNLNPRTEKDRLKNKNWVDRYVEVCFNSNELKEILNIK
jgi:hypothetical protein